MTTQTTPRRPSVPDLLRCLLLGDGALSEDLSRLVEADDATEADDAGERYDVGPCVLRGVWCGLAAALGLWALVAALAGAC